MIRGAAEGGAIERRVIGWQSIGVRPRAMTPYTMAVSAPGSRV